MIASFKGFSKRKAENRVNLRATQSKIRKLHQYQLKSRSEYPPFLPSLPDWVWKDLFSSFPDWLIEDGTAEQLIESNIRYLDGVEALVEFGFSVWSKSQQAKAIASGIWYTYGTTLDGQQDITIYAKPKQPRLDFKNGKLEPIKYETPSGNQATPVLLEVPTKIAQNIFKRYNVIPLEGETFWQTVQRCNLPIVITEGVKKALCLIAHGIPAIALRGVDCGFKKGTIALHESLKAFATEGREIYICFDQDTKPKTIRNVSRALTKLSKAFESAGCTVKIPVWEPKLAKGIDDVLVVQSQNSQTWLDCLIKTAPSFKIWRKSIRKARLLSALAWLNTLTINPERLTIGERLPELPDLLKGAIHVVTAPMGAGKTFQVGKWAKASGYFVVVLTPLNSLGKQTAQRWGLPHRHDFGTDHEQQKAFQLLVKDANGVVLCIDSLERIQEFINPDTPLLVVIDEANQVLEGLNSGGTLKDRQSKILELFTNYLQIAARNGAIVLSEATIYPRTLNQTKTLSGIEQVRWFAHKSTAEPWQCEVTTGQLSGLVAEFIEAVAANKKLILTAASRNQGKKLERLIRRLYPHKTILRIDSETNQSKDLNQFFYDPNGYLKGLPELPDILILSPSVKSGVSIEIEGFDEVWGIFTCLNPSVWIQQLGRYRLPVPRKIFSERFILTSDYNQTICSKQGITRNLQANLKEFSGIFNLAEALESQDEQNELIARIQASQLEFYSESQTAIGIEKQFAAEVLSDYLEAAAHRVEQRTISTNTDWHNKLKEIQEELWREEAEAIAAAQPNFDLKEAHQLLQQPDLSTELRLKAQKVIWRDEFPGVTFKDPKVCYEILTKNFGRLRSGVLLQSRAANLDQFKRVEAERIEAILKERIKLPHRLSKQFFQAALIQGLGLLELLDGSPYNEQDNRVIKVKQKALHYANEIFRWFNLSIKPGQTGIQIVNKLLKKLGLKAKQLCRRGNQGEQIRIWGISDLCDPIRVKLLQAAYQKLDGDPSQIAQEMPPDYYQALQKVDDVEDENVLDNSAQPCGDSKPIRHKLLGKPLEQNNADESWKEGQYERF